MDVGSLRVRLSSPRKVRGEPGGVRTLRRTLKGDREAEREEGQARGV